MGATKKTISQNAPGKRRRYGVRRRRTAAILGSVDRHSPPPAHRQPFTTALNAWVILVSSWPEMVGAASHLAVNCLLGKMRSLLAAVGSCFWRIGFTPFTGLT